MKYCELCKKVARTYCESDQARLCWSCDATVHSANFLVARHSRAVLCHACHSPTPWIASGAELSVAVSACNSCAAVEPNIRSGDNDRSQEINNTTNDLGDGDERKDKDNQVVPWSPAATPPPPASSSSGESDGYETSSSCGGEEVFESPIKKRPRQELIEFLPPKRRCCSELTTRTSRSAFCSSSSSSSELRPLRSLRTTKTVRSGQARPAGSVAELAVEKFRPWD